MRLRFWSASAPACKHHWHLSNAKGRTITAKCRLEEMWVGACCHCRQTALRACSEWYSEHWRNHDIDWDGYRILTTTEASEEVTLGR